MIWVAVGIKVWEASYLPLGGVQTTTGSNPDLRFPGQWFQSESGLHQNWMRDYDPTTGRYIQPDPLGLIDGASVYGYALQNPRRYIDPRGTCIGVLAYPCGTALGAMLSGTLGATGIVAMSTLPGSTPSDKATKAQERRAYSGFCKTPPPKTGDYCEDLKNELLHAKQCLAMRENFGKKWFDDNDPEHETENANLRNRISNKENTLRDSCPQQCEALGIK